MQTIGESVEITLSVNVPSIQSQQVADVLTEALAQVGHGVRPVNEEGDELYTIEEVFPDFHAGSCLRGLRGREGLSQKAMAEKLGLPRRHISEMEKGTRPISLEIAKLIDKTFKISYKVFL
jgi:DNA-binding XRE family transcriptional regulator